MDRQVFNTSLAPDIFIGEITGDLLVKGWNLPQVSLEAAKDSLQVLEGHDELRVSCSGDCEIRLPQAANLEIQIVQGDARLKLFDEILRVGTVNGSLDLREAAGLEAERIYGDFKARSISGDITVQKVLGDLEIRRLEGSCKIASIQGDAALLGSCGDLALQAGGDVRLNLSSLSGSAYTLQAGGDVTCLLPALSGLNLHLSSQAKSIQVHLADFNQDLDQEAFSYQIGDGGISLSIQAGGDIRLSASEAAWQGETLQMGEYGEQIARQVESQIGQQMQEVSNRLKDQMECLSKDLNRVGMTPADAQQIVDQAMRLSERETARAEEKIRRAQEKLERKFEEAQRKVEQKARSSERGGWTQSRRSWGRTWASPPQPPQPPQPPAVPPGASEEERLLILRMLEQKKITIDEAETLLQALEG